MNEGIKIRQAVISEKKGGDQEGLYRKYCWKEYGEKKKGQGDRKVKVEKRLV